MKRIYFFIIISLMLMGFSCSKDDSKPVDFKPVNLTKNQKALLQKSNSFGFEFFNVAFGEAGNEGNIMVSPLSISMALGMTRNGASGNTLTDMTRTLGFEGMDDADINQSYKYITETFASLDPKVHMSIANSIWYRNTYTVQQDFINTNSNYFNASVTPLDFNNPASKTTINNWVSEKTNKLIPSIVDEIPAESIMYLVNAIYFKGEWKYQFDKQNSVLAPFFLSNGTAIEAASMRQDCTLPYFSNAEVSAVELPYNQGNFAMTLLLPHTGQTLADVVANLNNSPGWKFVDTEMKLQIPQFKYEYDEKKMISILSQMGMGVAFSQFLADFTRINPDGGLYISDVKHKTFIEVNEDGTEAAAVTSVEVNTTSSGTIEPMRFTVNKPFVYYITEKSTGTVLFIGVVYNPTL